MSDIISADPKICHGKPTIKGTRIMVANILSLYLGGFREDKIVEYYPELSNEDVKATIDYARTLIPEDELEGGGTNNG
ncbi:MAG: DUF433 domain-containing protein [Deltaproteobacteria bacterium]|nr:DUF433 domain-containing protein [Deltaproteobacteria bacterium]